MYSKYVVVAALLVVFTIQRCVGAFTLQNRAILPGSILYHPNGKSYGFRTKQEIGWRGRGLLSMAPNDNEPLPHIPASEESLIIRGDAMEQQMAQLRSKYPTSESAYLAAARARSEARVASREQSATDQDWKEIQKSKRQAVGGDIDDWEESARESGNIDSQILIPFTDDSGGEDDEPKLLL